MSFLHAHAGEHTNIFEAICDEVLLHGILDSLKVIPFLFLTYLIMEIIEHKASSRARAFMEKSGKAGPAMGGILGVVPQCGFSAAASNFYTGRVITMGTLISIFLSTSDEMLPIMISDRINIGAIFAILGYKSAVGIFVGFCIDIAIRLMRRPTEHINIDELCENDDCHCERGVLFSALHHTLTVGGFVLLITLILNALIFFIGSDNLREIMYDKPFISHLIAAIIGLIPNCAASVALTDFCLEGLITAGTMMSGLFSGAGVGLIVLFRVNKRYKENLMIMAILVISGVIFGMLADLLNFSSIIQ